MKTKSLSLLGLIALPLILSCSNTQTFHIDEGSIEIIKQFDFDDPTTSTWNSETRTLSINDDSRFYLIFQLLEDYTGLETKYNESDRIEFAKGHFCYMLKNGISLPTNIEQFNEYRRSYLAMENQDMLLIGKSETLEIDGESTINRIRFNAEFASNIEFGIYNIWEIPDSYIDFNEGSGGAESLFKNVKNSKNLFTFNIINNIDV